MRAYWPETEVFRGIQRGGRLGFLSECQTPMSVIGGRSGGTHAAGSMLSCATEHACYLSLLYENYESMQVSERHEGN